MIDGKRVGVVVTAAGSGSRMGGDVPKQYALLEGVPVLQRTLTRFWIFGGVDEVVCVVPEPDVPAVTEDIEKWREDVFQASALSRGMLKVVSGGQTRQVSVQKGVSALSPDVEWVAVHDGVRPFFSDVVLEALFDALALFDGAVPGIPASDTLKRVSDGGCVNCTESREGLWHVQTPQCFRREVLERAYAHAAEHGLCVTDESALVEAIGGRIRVIPGEKENIKLTTPEDMAYAQWRIQKARADCADVDLMSRRAGGPAVRIGTGYDVHKLVTGRPLVLGGVVIPHEKGLLGHSDADVLTHAIMDAILGALCEGDIGRQFPDGDMQYKDISSLALLERVALRMGALGYEVGNIDATLVAQAPKMAPHIPEMRRLIARCLGCGPEQVNIKATTTEGLGFEGTGQGISAQAAALLSRRGFCE